MRGGFTWTNIGLWWKHYQLRYIDHQWEEEDEEEEVVVVVVVVVVVGIYKWGDPTAS
jgi:hypothetical protein